MEHIDLAAARPVLSLSTPRSQRRWVSALALGLLGGFAMAWGSPSQATSTASEPTVSGASDAAALQSRCEQGDAIACNNLGVTALHALASDPGVAVRSFERACLGGSADGCSNLGASYEHGAGVRTELTEAARLYEQACSGGAPLGCSNLGALYARGQGVARDASQAQRLFELACDTGSAAGCNNLMMFSAR